jgi:hypothetical protein
VITGRGRLGLVALPSLAILVFLIFRVNPLLANDGEKTATPTKTPRSMQALTTVDASLDLDIIHPTPTFTPTPRPTDAPKPAKVTPVALSPYLKGIATQYQLDTKERFVVIDPNLQKMTIWEPGKPIREFPVSTGDDTQGYRTPAWHGRIGRYWGTFNAFGVYADEGWYLYEDQGSILIHSAPYIIVNGIKIYEQLDALGKYPASRGCIRLHPDEARWFTAWQPQGVALVVLPTVGTPAG